ncbi:MAG TPA: hypothetical protein VK850_06010 [Candidatus Binatia bacterium]|nr:hypothetical protein [Candidatus Binatia bacterium]
MTQATIPAFKKHLYFYTLLVLGTLLLATMKSACTVKAAQNTRAAAVNKLANTLFQ